MMSAINFFSGFERYPGVVDKSAETKEKRYIEMLIRQCLRKRKPQKYKL